jgi:predicted MFS family arabinose efflux permease
MDGIAGYSAWRWIFIIEGLMTVVFGIIAFFWVLNFPKPNLHHVQSLFKKKLTLFDL